MNISKIGINLLLPLIFVLNIIVWGRILSFYFTQDDFFILRKVIFLPKNSFYYIFSFNNSVNYYRPFGVELYFFFVNHVFGLNPVAFHAFSLVFHLLNIFLLYTLILKITKKSKIALLAVFFWSLSSIHFLSLGWIVNFSFILAAGLYFLSFIFWLDKKNGLSILFFVLSLLSNEIALTLPIVIFCYSFLFEKKRLLSLMPGFLVLFIYFIARFWLLRAYNLTDDYMISFSFVSLIKNLQWYLVWSLGWPETMKDQMVNLFKYNQGSSFLKGFWKEYLVFNIFLWVMVIWVFFVVIRDWRVLKKDFYDRYKVAIFGVIWFIVSLLPVIFFPNHSYPHYLIISLSGMSVLLAFITIRLGGLGFLFVCFWLAINLVSINLNYRVNWLVWNSQRSINLLNKVGKNYLKGSDTIIIKGDKVQNSQVLSDQNAMKVIFGDDKIKTIYIDD